MVGENAVEMVKECQLALGASSYVIEMHRVMIRKPLYRIIQLSLSLLFWLSLSLSDIIKVIQFITSLVTSKLQAKIRNFYIFNGYLLRKKICNTLQDINPM